MKWCHGQACAVFKAFFFSIQSQNLKKKKTNKLQTFGEPFQTITQSALA